jgi:membrane associated rhomboid family serine protease
VFNVVSLVLIGSVAEHLWGTGRWVVIFAVGGIVSEIVALKWQPIGAGNSVANFSLAGAVCVFCVMRHPPRPVVTAACIALGGCGALLLRRDIHGAAGLIGAAMGLALFRPGRLNGSPQHRG